MNEISDKDSLDVIRLKNVISSMQRNYDILIAEYEDELNFYRKNYPQAYYVYESYCEDKKNSSF